MNPSYDSFNPSSNGTRRWLLIALAAVVLCFVAYGIYQLTLNVAYSAKLEIEVAPASSVITVDGKRFKAGIVHVKPGTATVRVSRDGFDFRVETVKAEAHKTVYVGVILSPNTPGTANWYTTHPADQSLNERISGRLQENLTTAAAAAVPLIKKLPYVDSSKTYRIDYGRAKGNDKPVIYITSVNESAKQAALAWIQKGGDNPAALTIQYINDPLLNHLPHVTLSIQLTDGGFTVDDSGVAFQTINATITLNNAESVDKTAAINQHKQEITNYIKSFGADPNSFLINYTIK